MIYWIWAFSFKTCLATTRTWHGHEHRTRSGLVPMYGMVSSRTNPHSVIMQSWWLFLIYSANVLTAQFPYFHFKAWMFGLTNVISEFFSFNDQMFTTLPPPFLTFSIFFIISCAFEALITPFLYKYHCSLQQ